MSFGTVRFENIVVKRDYVTATAIKNGCTATPVEINTKKREIWTDGKSDNVDWDIINAAFDLIKHFTSGIVLS